MSLTEHFGRTPAAFQAVASLFRLLGASEDPMAFIRHARNGNIEAAFDTIDRPNDELHREVTAMRKLALDADAPEPTDDEREILFP
ncbi:hypothetical protein PM033_11970 [Halorubrum ezzemoulense]|uniref:hypothetical protein n=1 Tax=Halorubrum ezzemoulense TaxID=337243 RepID=UPI00232D53D0|nr:hypothetical protein [Halorubrum ezzemoulense]MDB2252490.1 hypothetical protein [Halorubrum ezzemoulense]